MVSHPQCWEPRNESLEKIWPLDGIEPVTPGSIHTYIYKLGLKVLEYPTKFHIFYNFLYNFMSIINYMFVYYYINNTKNKMDIIWRYNMFKLIFL